MASSNNIIITFSIAILLLLILLLLISYNSKCKMNNSEKFENDTTTNNNQGNLGYLSSNQLTPSSSSLSGTYVQQSPVSNSVADVSNQKYDINMPSSGIGNVEPSNSDSNSEMNIVNNAQSSDNLTSNDLLPNDPNSKWSQINPSGSGDLRDQNYLTAGYHLGINTIGTSLRNANLQLRSEIPNPQLAVSPWMISTIEPDSFRPKLEIGTTN